MWPHVLSQSGEALHLLFAFCYFLSLQTDVAWGNTSDICLVAKYHTSKFHLPCIKILSQVFIKDKEMQNYPNHMHEN